MQKANYKQLEAAKKEISSLTSQLAQVQTQLANKMQEKQAPAVVNLMVRGKVESEIEVRSGDKLHIAVSKNSVQTTLDSDGSN